MPLGAFIGGLGAGLAEAEDRRRQIEAQKFMQRMQEDRLALDRASQEAMERERREMARHRLEVEKRQRALDYLAAPLRMMQKDPETASALGGTLDAAGDLEGAPERTEFPPGASADPEMADPNLRVNPEDVRPGKDALRDVRRRGLEAAADIIRRKREAALQEKREEREADRTLRERLLRRTVDDAAANATAIADAIERGDQPPDLKGLYRYGAATRAELSRRGFDLTTASRDWQAVQRHISTLNGPQQERLRQAISFTHESLDVIEDLYRQWKQAGLASGVKIFNRAALVAAKNLPGEAGAIATSLEAQINDLTSELGTVYKGGNASTDESLRLAAENLKADWNEETFAKALAQLRKNLQIRRNSIVNSAPVGVSIGSRYAPPPPAANTEAAPPPSGTVIVREKASGRRKQHDRATADKLVNEHGDKYEIVP